MINRSFQLLRTNTALTTNIKLVVTSDYKLYLESFDTNKQLSDQKFKHFSLNRNNLYEEQIVRFYDGLSSQLAFDVKYDNDVTNVFSTYDKQFDDIYWSGAKSVEDNWYKEDFEYFAPLYLKRNSIPDGFIVLRVDDPTAYEDSDNDFNVTKLTKDNFNTQIIDKWKCVNFFDMRYQSDLGYFLYNNYVNNTRFPDVAFELDNREFEYSKFYGIDYTNGVYVSKARFLQDILYFEQPHFKLEKEILNSFRSNNLIYPHILNMKFLFNDVPSTPDKVKEYSLNRYYGFYVDKLELVSKLTSYITPELKNGYKLKNNIFIDSVTGVEINESPFVEGFFDDKTYWIQYENDFYQVIKTTKNDNIIFQVLSDKDMSGMTFTKVNDRTCFINYQKGYGYSCQTISNPSGYTNYISGFTSNFNIDPYYKDGNLDSMYADLYVINIDGIYHVIKKRDGKYYVQSDYAINSFPTFLEYWKGGIYSKYYTFKPIYEYNEKPLSYPVYRIKFSDIKDFDFNRVNTHFSDFNYEKDTYNVTNEHKLYAVDYTDAAVLNKNFMIHPRGEDGQYQIMNVSSEYVADDELYEIVFNNLNDIWRKNQSVVKWGFAGSNSHCDYSYKLNNSIDIGDINNRTCDVNNSVASEVDKNLDYFYRIGNFYSGTVNNKVYYLNQTTNIEVDFMESYSKKFNLDLYLNSNVDYFDYFFKNKEYFVIDEFKYIRQTLKYSIFQSGDKYSQSNTLFKGLNVNIFSVNEISRDTTGKILNIIPNYSKNFNDYKFSIILNDVYEYYVDAQTVGINENGLINNNVINKNINGVHVFLNEKFKNVLVIINIKIPIQDYLISFNNIEYFGENYGLYNGKRLDGLSLINSVLTPTGLTEYNPSLLTANNFIDVFDDMNTLSGFDSGVTYYYINSDGVSGTTGPININPNNNSGNTMKNLPGWNKVYPPYVLNMNSPEIVRTKKQSYIKKAIKGPSTNIYNKYSTYYDNEQKQKFNVIEPLAREMSLNIEENNLNTVYVSNKVSVPNVLYRYNGTYEPIFNNIALFKNSYLYFSGLTSDSIKYWDSNYKFDTEFTNFGNIEELIYSKINPTISPLKLKNTDKDKSIYPMVDEYGYQYSSRFIFNSSWDKDFYIITNTDQNVYKQAFSNLTSVEYIIDPIRTKND